MGHPQRDVGMSICYMLHILFSAHKFLRVEKIYFLVPDTMVQKNLVIRLKLWHVTFHF